MLHNQILLVEDDLGLALPLKDYFEDNGLSVCFTTDGGEAVSLFKKTQPHLILLDIVLPNKNGFEIISEIRALTPTIPVIFMTGSEFETESQIRGYELGAINYMRKPILPKAILALIRHLLTLPKNLKRYRLKEYMVQIHAQAVDINGETFQVREKDALLLEALLLRINQIVPRTQLLQQIWLDDHPDKNNLLDGSIHRLKRLFSSYRHIQIKSVYGSGYVLTIQ